MAMVKEGVSIMHRKVKYFPVIFTWWLMACNIL
jgi:hypothetical protein